MLALGNIAHQAKHFVGPARDHTGFKIQHALRHRQPVLVSLRFACVERAGDTTKGLVGYIGRERSVQAPIDDRITRDVQLAIVVRPKVEETASAVDAEHEVRDDREEGFAIEPALARPFLGMLAPGVVFVMHRCVCYRRGTNFALRMLAGWGWRFKRPAPSA